MRSSSGKHRRRELKRGHMGPSIKGKGARKRTPSKRIAPTESFAAPPSASRRMISLPKAPGPPPAFKLFLGGFLAVVVLVLLGGSYNAVALGVALLLPGVALLIKTPTKGLGKLGDFGFIGLLVCLLLAFIPQFYWPSAAWRVDAVESFGIDLPATLSVQPWISFEAWLLTLAGFAWLYTALQWPVNLAGRRWLYFGLSILICGVAGLVVWGNLMGAHYPAASELTVFSYFKNQNLTASFLAIGGIATFIYAIEGLRSRNLVPLMGVPASVLCFAGLLLAGAAAGVLLYFSGIALWFICSLRSRSLPRSFKFGFPLVVLVFGLVLVNNDRTMQRITNFVTADSQLNDELRLAVYTDVADMVLAAPLSGFGLGSFSAVFPQYREASANFQSVLQPKSDLLWLASEGGLLALGFLAVFLFAYAKRCHGMMEGASASYRLLALVAVIIFILNGLIDVPGHRPGTVYFAILFAALALPTRTRPATHLPKFFWRASGTLLVLFGLLWLAAGLFNAPFYSAVKLAQAQATFEAQVAEEAEDKKGAEVAEVDAVEVKSVVDGWVSQRPLDWRAYSTRAQLTLKEFGDLELADADFDRARFVEPTLGVVSTEEGRAWSPYDPDRVVAAWRETLLREVEDKDRTYAWMLEQASESSKLRIRMAQLSEVAPYYRAIFLRSLRGSELQQEMARELSKDPELKGFNVKLRTEIVENWVKHGDLDLAEAFLRAHGESLFNSWWLWSLLLKDQADFQQAINQIREHVEVPSIPAVKVEGVSMERLTREYAVDSGDVMKGTTLISIYLKGQQYEKALSVLDRLLETPKAPLFLYYWRAECLYHLQDYIESWYSFEKYLERLWQRNDATQVALGS